MGYWRPATVQDLNDPNVQQNDAGQVWDTRTIPSELKTKGTLAQLAQALATGGDLSAIGFSEVNPNAPSGLSDGRTQLQNLQRINPGGQVVTGPDGKLYWQINPGSFGDAGLSGSFSDFIKPLVLAGLAAGTAGASGLFSGAGGLVTPEILASAGGAAGGALGAAPLGGAVGAAFGGGAATGAGGALAGGLLGAGAGASLADMADGTQSPAPVQEGPTTPSTGPGGSLPPISELPSLPPGTSSLGSLLQNLLGGGGDTNSGGNVDLLKLLGIGGAGALSAVGANNARDTLHQIYNQITGAREPSLTAYNNAVQNPNTWYQSAPAMGAADAASRALSTQGNPADNPGLISQLAANNLGGYLKYLNTLSGPALGGQPLQAALGQNLATLAQSTPNSLAQGLGSLTGTDQASNLLSQLSKLLNPTTSAGSAGTTTGSPDFTNSLNNSNPFDFNSTPQLTDTSTQDLLKQFTDNPNWFGAQNNFGQTFDLNKLASL